MPDPVSNQSAQWIAQKATAGALAKLLQGGPQSGRVISSSRGQAEVLIGGKTYTVDVKGQTFKAGDAVQAKILGGKVTLQPAPAHSNSASSLTTALQQLGLQGPAAQHAAEALLRAGAPLNHAALKELTQLLPQLSGGQVSALAFLISRGLPINDSLTAWAAYLLKPRGKLGDSIQTTRKAIDALLERLAGREDIPRHLVERLTQLRQDLEESTLAMKSGDADELEALIQRLLSTAAGRLRGGGDGSSETLMKLLKLMREIEPFVKDSATMKALRTLIDSAQQAHEHADAQAFRNVPPQSTAQSPTLFAEVPLREQDEAGGLELRYRKAKHDGDYAAFDMRVTMSALGPVCANLLWRKPSLKIMLTVSSDEAKSMIEPGVDGVVKRLGELGFQVDAMRVQTGSVPETLKPEDDFEAPATPRGVDVKA